jgi:hypothetical protein
MALCCQANQDGPSDKLLDEEIKMAIQDSIDWVGSNLEQFGFTNAQSGGIMLLNQSSKIDIIVFDLLALLVYIVCDRYTAIFFY